jgi:hypothetical protein
MAVPDGVDAAIERMQTPRLDAPRDRLVIQPRIEELPDPDDTALAAGECGDPRSCCV